MSTRPHIIIFNPDQMQCDALAHMGRNPAAQTPFLDRFAGNEAASYRNAYCQNPVCVPSRCSFLTGLYPHVHGHPHHALYAAQRGEQPFLRTESRRLPHLDERPQRLLPGQDEAAFAKHASEIFYGNDVPPAPGPLQDLRGQPGSRNYYSHYKGSWAWTKTGATIPATTRWWTPPSPAPSPTPNGEPLCLFLGLMYPHPPYQAEEPIFPPSTAASCAPGGGARPRQL